MPKTGDVLVVYVPCPSEDVAATITKSMIEQRYAACGHILPAGRSFFRWDGKVQDEAECAVLFKTTKEAWPALRDAVKAAHPYEVPCILALPVQEGSAPFLQWVQAETILP